MSAATETVAERCDALAISEPEPDWQGIGEEMRSRGAPLARTRCGCVVTTRTSALGVKPLLVVYPCRTHTPHVSAPCAVCGRTIEALSDHVHGAWRL